MGGPLIALIQRDGRSRVATVAVHDFPHIGIDLIVVGIIGGHETPGDDGVASRVEIVNLLLVDPVVWREKQCGFTDVLEWKIRAT